jgi:cytochrome P450
VEDDSNVEAEVFFDMFLMLFGGVDNLSHSLQANIYYFCKNPEWIKILRDEIQTQVLDGGKIPTTKLADALTSEKLDGCEKLTWFIKEVQ